MNSAVGLSLLAVTCAVASGVLIAVLLKTGAAARLASDVPNERSLHATPVPRVGGIVVVAVTALCILVLVPALRALAVVALGLMFVSAWDDRRGLPVGVRLAAHFVAASVASGLLLPHAAWWIIALAVVAIAWSINLYNFMDGADGLAGGMTLFGFSAFAIVAANGGAYELAAACGCVAGAAAGFLFHNFPPAKVFLGDAGSVPLGFLAATLGVAGYEQRVWPAWFPVLVFSPFIVDATITLLRRVLARNRVWEAHREHLYQRMVMRGWGHARTAAAWYALMALVVASGIAAVSWPNRGQIGLLIGWVALYAVLYAVVSRLTAPDK